ncbi:CDP-diacylglycerol--serine O-phosphatidyltransferase [Plesiomonas shigelloides]|uniref:CDP-diacylglycerol--serine O-phosphatidyltransferase n=1 Tax=Plesiomonas shigelloides TaxID=703 RepID=UPI0012621013|nr:CDP-diacylglycerol--serine O-phosphatidyltransferase [Plesiomonas shigelloides]KAB7704348.1 CDP-diacylglycerol--serine O-phosphatidyltransferase [Plesiomonas shigelloides]
MLSKLKRNKNQQHLELLPCFPLQADCVTTFYQTEDFRLQLLRLIEQSQHRIYLSALYLENDEGGRDVLQALYAAKAERPQLDIRIFVDWHRAQRGRIGEGASSTNAGWYTAMAKAHPETEIPIYGVPVNTREALGVLHLKGFVFDDSVLYSGASLNNVYLHRLEKYRYDRYHQIQHTDLANSMVKFMQDSLMNSPAVQRLDRDDKPTTQEIKVAIKRFRHELKSANYETYGTCTNADNLSIRPLCGLGKRSALNLAIQDLFGAVEEQLTICTPYFNLPAPLVKSIHQLLAQGKRVEIIIGDKTANDFFIPPEEKFKIIGALPYLYEINLRRFMSRLQRFINSEQLVIRLWKDSDNSYHLKGVWVDNRWQMLTGNNLNPRAWGLDLENALLIHDPKGELQTQRQTELEHIRQHTRHITHYQQLENLPQYPEPVRKLLRRLSRMRIDRLINKIL